jgi:beta-mannosidase
MRKQVLFFVLLFWTSVVQSRTLPDRALHHNWTFKQAGTDKSYRAQVPGTIHTDLMYHGLIPDPFWRDNEKKVQWVSHVNWDYDLEFKMNGAELMQDAVWLRFDGLDTYADVWLNDHLILQANNMFRTYRMEVSEILQRENKLHIRFYSADSIANELANAAMPLVRPCENNRHYVRKAQYHFGWDWAPKLTTCGIWRDVSLCFGGREIEANPQLSPVNLVQKLDSIGQSFYFTVNGNPTYMKGANWVPADVFLPRVDRAKYRNLLLAAKEANFNMLRVWGGGIYESEDFYELCDSLGIYVWQDFMFAGAMYPTDSLFLRNIEQELRDNILRLRKHKCIVLWCGNNEINEAWFNWGWQKQFSISSKDSLQLVQEYEQLFHTLIPKLLDELDPQRDYIPSSPLFGWGRAKSMTHGDSHYWGLWWGGFPLDTMKKKIPRFMSEFGMQAMPNLETIHEFATLEDFNLESDVMAMHQKFPRGYAPLKDYLKMENLPNSNFIEFVSSTQELQSRALQVAIQSQMNSSGRCMGSLFWQFNDCWPVCSWSIMDYYGRKKKAYYTVQKEFGKK